MKALALLGALPSRQSLAADVEDASYLIALDGVTRFGLAEAVKFILRGALGHAFFPSPPELRIQCDKAMEWPEREAERVRRREQIAREHIPARQELSDGEKARHEALMAKFNAGYATKAEDLERAEIRARYGMTDEVLAVMKDQPVPSNFKQARA